MSCGQTIFFFLRELRAFADRCGEAVNMKETFFFKATTTTNHESTMTGFGACRFRFRHRCIHTEPLFEEHAKV
jgi:hypothetical protein